MEEQGAAGLRRDSDDDLYKSIHVVRNSDGSLNRSEFFPVSPPNTSPASPVLSKDVPLNPALKTWVRIFLPREHAASPTPSLPLILHFHGGGFILFSTASQPFHASCECMALRLPAVVVSVEYRLAPEHPLPAAYEDALDALRWIRDESAREPWLRPADASRCFLMGSSSGGNIAYHAALRWTSSVLRIAGLVLNQPFFGGEARTESELRLASDRILPLPLNDLMWRLSLPEGADRDHEFCNPRAAAADDDLVRRLARCLVIGHGQDPLVDRQKEVVRILEERGVQVTCQFDEDGYHAIEMFDTGKHDEMLSAISDFVYSGISAGPVAR